GEVAGATVRAATAGIVAANARQRLPDLPPHNPHGPLRPTAITLRDAARVTAVRATAAVTAGAATVAAATSRRAENRLRRHKPKNPRNETVPGIFVCLLFLVAGVPRGMRGVFGREGLFERDSERLGHAFAVCRISII